MRKLIKNMSLASIRPGWNAQHYLVLIVQDSYEFASMLAELLESASIKPIGKAENVREAIWCVRECRPRVMILDMNIPLSDADHCAREFGGLEVARQAAQLGFNMSRIIVSSAQFEAKELESFGIQCFMPIPKPDQLISAVKSMLDN